MSFDQPVASSSASSPVLSSQSPHPAPGPDPTPTTSTSPNQSPTIFVSYGQRSVKARVDREVPLSEIIRQLVASSQLGISEPAILFALREKETGTLVTDDNLLPFLDQGLSFVLTSSPTIEAAEMVEKLQSGEASVLKLATFSLRSLITERAFLDEFQLRGGFDALQEVIKRATGNTLAYSLLSMQSMLDLEDRGWAGLHDGFAARIVEIITNEPLINITRPATAILRRLSLTAPPLPWSEIPSPPPSPAPAPQQLASGFSAVWSEIQMQDDFLKVVIGRLSSGDQPLAALSLGLLNSLLKGSNEIGDTSFADELEKQDAWKAIGRLLESHKAGGDLLNPILTFQAHLISALHLVFMTRIAEQYYPLFDEIWAAATIDDPDETNRWRRLGFRTETPQFEFDSTGLLGLRALAKFAQDSTNEFALSLKEQLSRPEDRRCPLASASSAVLLAVSEHFDVPQGASTSPTVAQPCLLRFFDCHALALAFFVRIWTDSGAKQDDFARILTLTKSQISASLGARGDKDRTWFAIRREFLGADYKAVRDRAVKENDLDEELGAKAPVKSLKGRLYADSFEFVRAQRIMCLHEGAWFKVPSAGAGQGNGNGRKVGQAAKGWRFYRLAANRKTLHYLEAAERGAVRGGLDDLPNKIDLALVTDVVPSGAALQSRTNTRNQSIVSLTSSSSFQKSYPSSTSPLAFSLLSSEGVVAELVAPDQATYAEWLDGLALLRPEGNISTQETTDLINALTEVGMKVKLLDLTGMKVDIPGEGIQVGPPPASTDFFFADNF